MVILMSQFCYFLLFKYFSVNESAGEDIKSSTNHFFKEKIGQPVHSSTPAISVAHERTSNSNMQSFRPVKSKEIGEATVARSGDMERQGGDNTVINARNATLRRTPKRPKVPAPFSVVKGPLIRPPILKLPTLPSTLKKVGELQDAKILEKTKSDKMFVTSSPTSVPLDSNGVGRAARSPGCCNLSTDPVSDANAMWSQYDSEQKQEAAKKRLREGEVAKSNMIQATAEIHHFGPDKRRDMDDDNPGETYTTASAFIEQSPGSVKDSHPQNQEVIDLSEQEVRFGKKNLVDAESMEDTVEEKPETDQKTLAAGISDPMKYRDRKDFSHSESDNDEQRSDASKESSDPRFGLFD